MDDTSGNNTSLNHQPATMVASELSGQTEEVNWSKARILKNLAVVCAGVFLFLSAALPASEIQSSLHFDGGLGTKCNSIGAWINIIPSFILPPYLIRKFGLKPCMVAAICVGAISFFGNFYSSWGTLILYAILSNLGVMPMWTSKGTYITHISEMYSKLVNADTQVITNLFFGIFYSTYYCGYIFGNLLPYYILAKNESSSEPGVCGYRFCDATSAVNNTNFEEADPNQVYELFGIFAGISFAGALVVFLFLDGLAVPHTKKATWSRALDAFRMFKHWIQWCMATISFYRGFNRVLLTADFTKAYITCTWGLNHVGYVMLSFGVGCGTLSVTLGYLVRWIGRPALFAFAVLSNVGIMLTMIFWDPNPDQYVVFFILVTLWGASNAVWESQVAALNPKLYPEQRDAAYTNYANVENVGSAIGLAISAPLCMSSKIYLNLAVLGAAAVCYVALEAGPLRRIKREEQQQQQPVQEMQNGGGTWIRKGGKLQRKPTGYPRPDVVETNADN